jgi:hypothetical protein
MKRIFISIIISLVITNYLEMFELPYAIKIRNLIYYGSLTDRENGEVKYTFSNGEKLFNPVSLAQEVLPQSQCLLSTYYITLPLLNCKEIKINHREIMNSANNILKHLKYKTYKDLNFAMLPYDFYLPIYDLKAPWYSGMAQGHAIEVLLAAYNHSKEDKFKNNAILIGNSFKVNVSNGGVKVNLSKGLWYEEYASNKKTKHPLVLNGHNFALDALFWLKQEDSSFEYYFNEGLLAVKENVETYYSLSWTYYDRFNNIADKKYHNIHIAQLERLNKFREDDAFTSQIIKMKILNLLPFGFIERLIFTHNRMVLFLLFVNTMFIYIILFIVKRVKLS